MKVTCVARSTMVMNELVPQKWLLAGAWLLGLVIDAPAAVAQTYLCPPPPEGVFGLNGGPKFAEATLPDDFASQLDDPRWNGAWREDFQAAASTEAGVRMLKEGNFLFISFRAKVDPSGASATDAVRLGFSRNGLSAEMFEIGMSATAALTNSNQITLNRWWTTSDGGATNWSRGPNVLPWARPANIHAWSEAAAPITPPNFGTANGDDWAINVKIDLAAVGTHLDGGGPLSADFRMWYEIDIRTSAGSISYAWPPSSGLPQFVNVSGEVQVLANSLPVASWGRIYPTVASNCPTGVSIDPMKIGIKPVVNGVPKTYPVHFGDNHAPNDFVARLDYGSTLPNNSVKARFRIANWGSTIGVGGDWKDMIPGSAGLPGTRNNVGNEITFHCVNPPDTSDAQCYQKPAGAPADQCLLVQLEQANGSGIKFLSDSARRNLDFVDASEFERSAEISVRDLAPLPNSGGKRDLYLYVRTLNMPNTVEGNPEIRIPPPVPFPERPDVNNLRGAVPPPKPEGPPAYRLTTYERYASVMPTYEVHVYHDTGIERTYETETVKVLEPQAPFGYFVRHAGDLAGWEHELTGEGFVLEELSSNFYHAIAPDNGSIKVHTRIASCKVYAFNLFRCCCDFVGAAHGGGREAITAMLMLMALFGLRCRGRAVG